VQGARRGRVESRRARQQVSESKRHVRGQAMLEGLHISLQDLTLSPAGTAGEVYSGSFRSVSSTMCMQEEWLVQKQVESWRGLRYSSEILCCKYCALTLKESGRKRGPQGRCQVFLVGEVRNGGV